MRSWAIFPLVLAAFAGKFAGLATASSEIIASDPPHSALIAERSPANSNQVSAAIDNALAKAGFNATEAAKIRDLYHVGVDQIDNKSDKSRELLDSALGKILSTPDVQKVDDALDVLIGRLGKIGARDLDAAAGEASGVEEKTTSAAQNYEALYNVIEKMKSGSDGYPKALRDAIELAEEARSQQLSPEERIDFLRGWFEKTKTGTLSPRSAPEVEGCDCKTVIQSVKETKPKDEIELLWYLKWRANYHPSGLNTTCIKPCVDKAIKQFVDKLHGFELVLSNLPKSVPDRHAKRDEAVSSVPVQDEAKIPVVANEPASDKTFLLGDPRLDRKPDVWHSLPFRDWFIETQQSGKYCTCAMSKKTVLPDWFVKFSPKRAERCAKFCKDQEDSVKPLPEKRDDRSVIPNPHASEILQPVAGDSFVPLAVETKRPPHRA